MATTSAVFPVTLNLSTTTVYVKKSGADLVFKDEFNSDTTLSSLIGGASFSGDVNSTSLGKLTDSSGVLLIEGNASSNVQIKLGDSAGVRRLDILDSTSTAMAFVNSNGDIVTNGDLAVNVGTITSPALAGGSVRRIPYLSTAGVFQSKDSFSFNPTAEALSVGDVEAFGHVSATTGFITSAGANAVTMTGGGTILSTANGDINLSPNGTGRILLVNTYELQDTRNPWKWYVRAATIGDIALSGAQTIDGVSVISGDRVLVKSQDTASQNGIYVAATGAWTRATDADNTSKFTPGLTVYVAEGSVNGGNFFQVLTPFPITVGTTAITFINGKFSGDLASTQGYLNNTTASTGVQVRDDTGFSIANSANTNSANIRATGASELTLDGKLIIKRDGGLEIQDDSGSFNGVIKATAAGQLKFLGDNGFVIANAANTSAVSMRATGFPELTIDGHVIIARDSGLTIKNSAEDKYGTIIAGGTDQVRVLGLFAIANTANTFAVGLSSTASAELKIDGHVIVARDGGLTIKNSAEDKYGTIIAGGTDQVRVLGLFAIANVANTIAVGLTCTASTELTINGHLVVDRDTGFTIQDSDTGKYGSIFAHAANALRVQSTLVIADSTNTNSCAIRATGLPELTIDGHLIIDRAPGLTIKDSDAGFSVQITPFSTNQLLFDGSIRVKSSSAGVTIINASDQGGTFQATGASELTADCKLIIENDNGLVLKNTAGTSTGQLVSRNNKTVAIGTFEIASTTAVTDGGEFSATATGLLLSGSLVVQRDGGLTLKNSAATSTSQVISANNKTVAIGTLAVSSTTAVADGGEFSATATGLLLSGSLVVQRDGGLTLKNSAGTSTSQVISANNKTVAIGIFGVASSTAVADGGEFSATATGLLLSGSLVVQRDGGLTLENSDGSFSSQLKVTNTNQLRILSSVAIVDSGDTLGAEITATGSSELTLAGKLIVQQDPGLVIKNTAGTFVTTLKAAGTSQLRVLSSLVVANAGDTLGAEITATAASELTLAGTLVIQRDTGLVIKNTAGTSSGRIAAISSNRLYIPGVLGLSTSTAYNDGGEFAATGASEVTLSGSLIVQRNAGLTIKNDAGTRSINLFASDTTELRISGDLVVTNLAVEGYLNNPTGSNPVTIRDDNGLKIQNAAGTRAVTIFASDTTELRVSGDLVVTNLAVEGYLNNPTGSNPVTIRDDNGLKIQNAAATQAVILSTSNTAELLIGGDINLNENQAKNFRTENIPTGSLPAAGNKGRLITDSTSNLLLFDNGTSLVALNSDDVSVSFRNKLINGSFLRDLWQRGTNFTATGYTADRWRMELGSGAAATVAQQPFVVGQTLVPGEPEFYLTFVRSTTGSTSSKIGQRIEYVRTLAGKNIVVSGFISSDPPLAVNVYATQNFGSGGSSPVTTYIGGINVVTGFVPFSVTAVLPSIASKTVGSNSDDFLEIFFELPTAAGSPCTLDLSQVQCEEGTRASTFEVRPPSVEVPMALRFFNKTFPLTTTPAQNAGSTGAIYASWGTSTGHVLLVWYFSERMRIPPTVITYNPYANNSNFSNGALEGAVSFVAPSQNQVAAVHDSNAFGTESAPNLHLTADAEL